MPIALPKSLIASLPSSKKKQVASNTVRPIRRKLVVVGDGNCGKTSLLVAYTTNSFPTDYIPTVFDNYVAETSVDQVPIELALWDTAGQEDYDRLRPLSYPDAQGILLCFCIDRPETLDSILTKWSSEINHFCPGVPKILVGLKSDLRTDLVTLDRLASENKHPVTPEQAMSVGEAIGAVKYCEASAKTKKGVRLIFDSAIRASLAALPPKKPSMVPCCIQ